jgi:hypothetical protein
VIGKAGEQEWMRSYCRLGTYEVDQYKENKRINVCPLELLFATPPSRRFVPMSRNKTHEQ